MEHNGFVSTPDRLGLYGFGLPVLCSFRPGSPRASGPNSKLSFPSSLLRLLPSDLAPMQRPRGSSRAPSRPAPSSGQPGRLQLLPSSPSVGSVFWATRLPPKAPKLPLGRLHLLGNLASFNRSRVHPLFRGSSRAPPKPAPSPGQPGLLRKLPSSPLDDSPAVIPNHFAPNHGCLQCTSVTSGKAESPTSSLRTISSRRPRPLPVDLGLFPSATRSPQHRARSMNRAGRLWLS